MTSRTRRFAQPLSRRLNRRRFTQALGAGLIAAPFARLLSSETAHAAPGGAKRVVFVMTCGTNLNEWPLVGSTANNIVTNTWNEGLDRIKDRIVVAENLNAGEGAHGSWHCLVPGSSNWAGPSMERVVADHFEASGVSRPISNLLLGADIDDNLSYFRDRGSIPTINSPTDALNLVFAGVDPGAEQDDNARAAALARRQSMLDVVRDDLNELHGMLGLEERPKLEAHLDSLRQYELRLTEEAPSGEGCHVPTLSDSSDPITVARAQMDLARATLACDISRVVGVCWGQHNRFGINLPDIDVVDDLHSLHHGPNKQDKLGRYENWFSHQFADFVESIAATPDPETGGSLLDTTLVVWVRGMGDAVNHSSVDMRLVCAGGPSVLDTTPGGRYVDAGGAEYRQGLAAIGSALGVTDPASFDGNAPLAGVLA